MADVRVDVSGLQRMVSAMTVGSPLIRVVYKRWAARYRSFAQERFDTFSKGGGDWPPLKPATVRRRRRGRRKKAARAAILADTGTLKAALNPVFTGKPGQLQKDLVNGIRVGFGGPGRYPDGTSIADIAGFHQVGAGNLPVRRIIVDPSRGVLDDMGRDLVEALAKIGRS